MPTPTVDTTKHLLTEVNIDAPRQVVWEILSDFENYENWNPFIIKMEGELGLGNKITAHMQTSKKLQTFTPKITLVEEGKHFEWLGSVPLGLFKGNHYFILEETGPNSCKLIHGERFSGLLRKSIMNSIGEETLENFKKMNAALKAEAESRR